MERKSNGNKKSSQKRTHVVVVVNSFGMNFEPQPLPTLLDRLAVAITTTASL
jgi:hypothetical protein